MNREAEKHEPVGGRILPNGWTFSIHEDAENKTWLNIKAPNCASAALHCKTRYGEGEGKTICASHNTDWEHTGKYCGNHFLDIIAYRIIGLADDWKYTHENDRRFTSLVY